MGGGQENRPPPPQYQGGWNSREAPVMKKGATNRTVFNPVVADETQHTKQLSAVPSKPSAGNLRSPICSIMGDASSGKTMLLHCIRGSNVQQGHEACSFTHYPAQEIRGRSLLVIDAPCHQSFKRSGLCDIAILVVDIMHGIQQQTIDSLDLLKRTNTDLIIVLNKVDRICAWQTCRNAPIREALMQQYASAKYEFRRRVVKIVSQFRMLGVNAQLYYENNTMGETFSIVPTSAISGEGITDMLFLLFGWTQKTMIEKLTYSEDVQCTVLEVKVIEGYGTTIDVVLAQGVLRRGDQIVVSGMKGPIVTTIRALLTPHPMEELCIKGSFMHHKEIKAVMGVKITAQGLEHAIAGASLYLVKPDDDLEYVKQVAMEDVESVLSRIEGSGEGVCVEAPRLLKKL
uniref:Tr-type G domain-containing protein n=1 Tax=Medicago truncatula TaxID=3880 RepID=I3T0P8_MEDTR|nr:unknown [Medicago truncatula]